MNITLRAMEPEDLDLLYRIENDRALWDCGTTNVPYSRYTLHRYIAETQNNIYADEQVRLMIENDEHQTVGIIDLMRFDPRNQRAELGIVILKAHRGRGYAAAAVRRMAEHCRNVLHLHQLYSVVAADNTQSLQLFRSVGFTEGARLQDWLCQGGEYHDAVFMQLMLDKAEDVKA